MKGTEMSASELLKTCRKYLDDVKTEGILVNPGGVWELPVYCPHGVRHEGSMTAIFAQPPEYVVHRLMLLCSSIP